MSPPRLRRFLTYAQAREELTAADLLLFRPRPLHGWAWLDPFCWFSQFITTFGRSPYCHAAKAIPVMNEWFAAETVEGVGGRLYPIRRYAEELPGLIDVFRLRDDQHGRFNRYRSAVASLSIVGTPYGWRAVATSAALHLPFIRQIVWRQWETGALDDDEVLARPPYCSAAAAWADRTGGGVDPVSNLADGFTEPGDLARSPLYHYLFTLDAESSESASIPFPRV